MVVLIIIAIILVVLFFNIKIVPQANVWVVESFGKYKASWGAGLHIKIPIVDQVVRKVSIKEQVADFEPQPVITKDNVTMMVDSVVFFEIFDAELFTYGVERPIAAIENLSATTLRNIIGSMTLDETLTSRDNINKQITAILDGATDRWGIKVNRVEVKNIQPPRSIQDAMEKQMKAEREKREQILTAEGKKQSAITLAEGEKQAAILRAEAVREQKIREAQGEAEALLAIQRARAEGIRLINAANPSNAYLQLEQYKAAEKMADGQATKIVVPSDIAKLTSIAGVLADVVKTPTSSKPVTPRVTRNNPNVEIPKQKVVEKEKKSTIE